VLRVLSCDPGLGLRPAGEGFAASDASAAGVVAEAGLREQPAVADAELPLPRRARMRTAPIDITLLAAAWYRR
jgi:hypothetical protein